MTTETPAPRVLRVWDIATRAIHWALVVLVPFSWWSAESLHLAWHRWSGYTILSLLVLRIYWGFAGSETARFARFVKSPAAALRYGSGLFGPGYKPSVGHNPLGGLSVVALLAVLITQISLGLFAVDVDGIESGPLSNLVSFDTGRQLAGLHHLNFYVLLGLIALHLSAITFYALRRENLVAAMLTGRKLWRGEIPTLTFAPLWRVVPGIIIAAAVALAVAKGFRF